MIVHKGPHYRYEVESIIQQAKEKVENQRLRPSTIHFIDNDIQIINNHIQNELIQPFNESFGWLVDRAITKCEYRTENSWGRTDVKLSLEVNDFLMDKIQEEDVSLAWPF